MDIINPTIIECDKFNSYENQIPLLGGARGGFMKNKIFKNHKLAKNISNLSIPIICS